MSKKSITKIDSNGDKGDVAINDADGTITFTVAGVEFVIESANLYDTSVVLRGPYDATVTLSAQECYELLSPIPASFANEQEQYAIYRVQAMQVESYLDAEMALLHEAKHIIKADKVFQCAYPTHDESLPRATYWLATTESLYRAGYYRMLPICADCKLRIKQREAARQAARHSADVDINGVRNSPLLTQPEQFILEAGVVQWSSPFAASGNSLATVNPGEHMREYGSPDSVQYEPGDE